jgi:hypothetical protein
MKKMILFVSSIVLFTACGGGGEALSPDLVKNPISADGKETSDYAVMTFDTIAQSFGTLVQGEKARMVFRFTNTGKKDLIINSATGSCGCTVPSYPKTPVKPGQSSEIEVLFNSEGKSGHQHKKVQIVANTIPATNTIAITGDIVGPDTQQ